MSVLATEPKRINLNIVECKCTRLWWLNYCRWSFNISTVECKELKNTTQENKEEKY